MMGYLETMRSRVAALVVGVAMGFAATAASAVTVNFDQYLTGTDLGNVTLATLTAVQNGSDVDLTFTNTGIAAGSSSFDTQLFLQYSGSTAGISLAYVGGVAVSSFSKAVNNVFGPWDLLVSWGTSNANNGAARLNVGEYSSFKLLNASLANLFAGSGSSPFAMIHVQGIAQSAGGGSTKYGGSVPSPVPLPAGGLLLIAALGGMAAVRRRKAAT